MTNLGMASNAAMTRMSSALNNMADPNLVINSGRPEIFSHSNTSASTRTGSESRNSKKETLIIKQATVTDVF